VKTSTKKLTRRKGLVLPAVFSVLIILMFLVLAVTSMGTTSLRQAGYVTQDDQAAYAAEAGLARALAQYQKDGTISEATGTGVQLMKGALEGSGATYQVNLYVNDGPGPMKVPTGAYIPEGTAFLVSEGRSQAERSVRRSAALVEKGLGTVEVGSLASAFLAENASFKAYDSSKEAPGYTGLGVDPNSLLDQQTIIATNESTGQPVKLTNSEVLGNILLGPGSDPNAQVSKDGTSTTQRVGVLEEPIELPPVEVPDIPGEDDTGAPPQPENYSPSGAANHVNFTQDANGKVTIINQCFTCVIQPNGDFSVSESSGPAGVSAKSASGNIKTGVVNHAPGLSTQFDIDITGSSFSVGGYWHGLKLTDTGQLLVDPPTNNSGDKWSDGNLEPYTAPTWLSDAFFKNIPPDLTNPSDMETGYFNNISIDSGTTVLQDSSTIVVNNLEITNGGQLNLPDGGKDVTIYVTGSLTIDGVNAILNETRKAPELKIYYTGTDPVQVSGGASTFMTLIAPDAQITLNGGGSSFYGALATKEQLTLKDAEFYYDIATEGVGTGTDGGTLSILAHQRL